MNFSTVKKEIKLVECPRDAMQGWKKFIATERKIAYLNALLNVGFDTIDCGSFVSPKAIPQMADTAAVLDGITLQHSTSSLLAIIANVRGAEQASTFKSISYLGFPFSVSETFQKRNTNSSITESLERVKEIHRICLGSGKQLVIYLSMGFGNPYGDPWSEKIVCDWADAIAGIGIQIISIADTVGLATAEQVFSVTKTVIENLPQIEIGVHLHSTLLNWRGKADAALNAGCRRFDGALKGVGGCPMADDDLVGNMNTELLIDHFKLMGMLPPLNEEALKTSINIAEEIFEFKN